MSPRAYIAAGLAVGLSGLATVFMGDAGRVTAAPGVQDAGGTEALGVPGEVPCGYENLRLEPAAPLGITHSQKSFLKTFYAETADDFVLTDPDDPNGANGCVLDEVVFGVAHDVPGISPQNWNGVKLTVYQDRGVACQDQQMDFPCQRNFDKGPGGYPLPSPDAGTREHLPCCPEPFKEAIVCELKVPMSKVTWQKLPVPGGYEIRVSELQQFNCVLEKNKKYWIAPAPEMDFFDPVTGALQGTTVLLTSPNPRDHEAQVISEFFGIPQWSGIQSQIGWFTSDLYLAVFAKKEEPPPAACHYENLRLGEPGPASQKAFDFPLYAETADDFVLTDPDDPNGLNDCQLDQVEFAVNGPPPDTWFGVKLTIYQDRGNVCAGQPVDPPCERNPEKGPGGYPLPSDDPTLREHVPCCPDPSKEAVVCELKVPMSQVTFTQFGNNDFIVTVSGLKDFNCFLEKNKKYWIAPAIEVPLMSGQVRLWTSPNPADHEAQTVDVQGVLAPPQWTQLQSQIGFPFSDLYLAVWANKAEPTQEPCVYDNLRKSGQAQAILSQKATDVPFWAEAADDFVLTDPDDPDGDNTCRLSEVEFNVAHNVAGVSPADWNGIKITIYQDRGVVCGGQVQLPPCALFPDKGPGGFPVANPDGTREHEACCQNPAKAAVVCELKIPISADQVTWTPNTSVPFADAYTVLVSGLESLNCNLEKNKKYWIAVSPEMNTLDAAGNLLGNTFLLTSPNPVDHEAQLYAPASGFLEWTPVSLIQVPPIPELDLSLAVRATKGNPCPWDCGDNDGIVGIIDFLALLSEWNMVGTPCDFDGGGVGIIDFLKLLANWGPCP